MPEEERKERMEEWLKRSVDAGRPPTESKATPQPRLALALVGLLWQGGVLVWRIGLPLVTAGLIVHELLGARSIAYAAILGVVGAMFGLALASAGSSGWTHNMMGRTYYRLHGRELSSWGAIMAALIGALMGVASAATPRL